MVMFKGLTFGDINSKDYGVFIEGQSAFNAPQRDVELIEIPGRNGAYVHDMGRYSNIEVTYPAGLFGHSESEFAEKISNFRNAICSKKGYQKLTDEYNPNEYRMGVYSSGLDVKPAILRAGEFDLKFNCKPQRFLTSGDIPVSVDSGDTLTNPTLFESHPLIECKGRGTLAINGEEIEVTLEPLGRISLGGGSPAIGGNGLIQLESHQGSFTLPINGRLNSGDAILFGGCIYKAVYNYPDTNVIRWKIEKTGADALNFSGEAYDYHASAVITSPAHTFIYGTSETLTYSFSLTISKGRATISEIVYDTYATITYAMTIAYDGDSTITFNSGVTLPAEISSMSESATFRFIYADSSVTIGNNSVYIDLDIGEAYMIVDDVPVSLNNSVILGATPPTLTTGNNVITFDNTITNVKFTPRWWKL